MLSVTGEKILRWALPRYREHPKAARTPSGLRGSRWGLVTLTFHSEGVIMARHLRLSILAVSLGLTLLGRLAMADSGWFWQNPRPQGNWLYATAAVDANTVFAVGAAGTILRTTDGGASWSFQSIGGASLAAATMGTAVGAGGTLRRTTRGGGSCSPHASGTSLWLSGVSFTDANNGTAVGGAGTILRTTDGGATWTPQASGTSVSLFSVSFTDANTGTAVGLSGTILRTIDGGVTWTPQASGTSVSHSSVH